MAINALCKSFQRLGGISNGAIQVRNVSMQLPKVGANSPKMLFQARVDGNASIYQPKLGPTPQRSSILDLPQVPAGIGRIGEFPIYGGRTTGDSPEVGSPVPLGLPTIESNVPKLANMIQIRRRKMRRHKLRKLRKKMKFYWAKVRQRRELKKEKAFHALLIGRIKEAEKFDAKESVAEKLAILDHVPTPTRYKGVHLPESQIREFLQKDKEAREKRMYRPRLKL